MTIAKDFPDFDAQTAASQGNAILGIRDSGKSYTAIGIAERYYDAGIPWVALDPSGRWRFIRVPGTGKGYPVVVAGGQSGDLPLTVDSAAEIARAAMESGISVVFDLYDMNISKADWKRIVSDVVRVLFFENAPHGLRHIFIEEAAEFCPQRVGPDQGRVYAEIEKLARMGGNARLGYTLINQRAEEVNKAVLELCDNLFLHRQKGRNSLNALTKWLDVADVRAGKEIISTLPTLPQGECWAWMAGTDRPVHVKVPQKNSAEPDRRAMRGDVAAPSTQAVDVAGFVQALKASLAESGAKKDEPETKPDAKAKRGNGMFGTAAPSITPEEAKSQAEQARNEGYRDGYSAGVRKMREAVQDIFADFEQRLGALDQIERPNGIMAAPESTPKAIQPRPKEVRPNAGRGHSPDGLDSAAKKLLAAFKRYPTRGLTWEEACIIAGLVPGNGYFYGGKKRLVEGQHLLSREDGRLVARNGGEKQPATLREIVETWSSKVKQPGGRMLQELARRPERTVTAQQVADALQLKPGNGFWYGGLKPLRDANLIVDDRGTFALAEFLREAPR